VERFHDRAKLDLPQRLAEAPRPGRPRLGGEGVDPLIARIIDTDPRELGYPATVWTAGLLSQYLRDHHDLEVSRKTVSGPVVAPSDAGIERDGPLGEARQAAGVG
jgi:hypothetical protein